ncbi:hypothetical protein [Cryobacterium serini]|nr:hypothetical protein [Cryobacterium serini]
MSKFQVEIPGGACPTLSRRVVVASNRDAENPFAVLDQFAIG